MRTLGSHIGYYERWAKTWEYQAMLKARPIAGDRDLGQAYVEAIGPLVWQAADRPGFVQDVQAMRRRVVDQIPVAQGDRELQRAILLAYGYDEAQLDLNLRARLMLLTVLYEYSDLRKYAERLAPEAIHLTLDELERGIWTFTTD